MFDRCPTCHRRPKHSDKQKGYYWVMLGRLAVPEIPYSRISEMGAEMYRGEKITRGKRQESECPSGLGGSIPTSTLQTSTAGEEGGGHA